MLHALVLDLENVQHGSTGGPHRELLSWSQNSDASLLRGFLMQPAFPLYLCSWQAVSRWMEIDAAGPCAAEPPSPFNPKSSSFSTSFKLARSVAQFACGFVLYSTKSSLKLFRGQACKCQKVTVGSLRRATLELSLICDNSSKVTMTKRFDWPALRCIAGV